MCLPIALPFVYVLCYRLFTFGTTVCLPFALPFVYRLHYRLFIVCTTVCLPFALPSVYVLYYRATFCLPFVLPCEGTTAVSGVRRITFRAKTCSVCRRSAGWPNECPSAVVRLSIQVRRPKYGIVYISALSNHHQTARPLSPHPHQRFSPLHQLLHWRRLV